MCLTFVCKHSEHRFEVVNLLESEGISAKKLSKKLNSVV